MKRAALFVAGFVVLGACANDFDALTAGPSDASAPKDKPAQDPQASGGTTQACAAKTCDAVVSNVGGQLNVAAQCCAYTTTCKDPFSCTTQCSNGAVCTGTCENEGACEFQVSGATGHFTCTTSACKLDCEAGATCTLDCTQSDSCDVTCDAKSTCVVKNCGDACDVTCADGAPAQLCGDRTRACGGCASLQELKAP